MANHFDRHYCGKCGLTYVYEADSAPAPKPKGKPAPKVEEAAPAGAPPRACLQQSALAHPSRCSRQGEEGKEVGELIHFVQFQRTTLPLCRVAAVPRCSALPTRSASAQSSRASGTARICPGLALGTALALLHLLLAEKKLQANKVREQRNTTVTAAFASPPFCASTLSSHAPISTSHATKQQLILC